MAEEPTSNEFSVKPFYDKINLIFHGILAMPLLAFVYLYLESNSGNLQPVLDEGSANAVNFVMPFVIFGLIVVAFYLFRNRLNGIDKARPLKQKLDAYFIICLVMYAMLEFGLITSVVGYYLTFSDVFIGMFVIVLVFFSLQKPTPYRIAKNLQLEGDEKEKMIYKK